MHPEKQSIEDLSQEGRERTYQCRVRSMEGHMVKHCLNFYFRNI
jgi:hypothetical protein